MIIKEISKNKSAVCRSILEALPDWFGRKDAREAYIHASEHQTMLVCEVDHRVVGMLTLRHHSPWNVEIAVMGVLPFHHRKGVGTALINLAQDYAKNAGVRLLSVKTLSEQSPDPNYVQTRAFYGKLGFELFEEIPALWGTNTPCAIYVCPVKAKNHAAT